MFVCVCVSESVFPLFRVATFPVLHSKMSLTDKCLIFFILTPVCYATHLSRKHIIVRSDITI